MQDRSLAGAYPSWMRHGLPEWVATSVAESNGVLGASALQRALAETGDGIERLAAELLPEAASRAHAPISGLAVGAVAQVRMEDGAEALVLGANFECLGAPLSCSIHAEQAVVSLARRRGARRIHALSLTAAPCGHCRQFLLELEDGGALRLRVSGGSDFRLEELLPHSFQPVALDGTSGMLAASPLALKLRDGSSDALVCDAFEAARAAYAPYSQAPAGAAVLSADGRSFTGCSLESVAFNPSLDALAAALSALAMARARGVPFAPPVRVVLVEVAGRASQRLQAEAMLGALAPRLALEVHAAELA